MCQQTQLLHKEVYSKYSIYVVCTFLVPINTVLETKMVLSIKVVCTTEQGLVGQLWSCYVHPPTPIGIVNLHRHPILQARKQ